jgi:NADPH2:quinone reductase
MRAVLCKQFGPPESLVIEDVPSPVATEGKVVVSVKAAAVNFPDTLIIQNKYQHKPPMPFSPGGDLAGVVKEVGPGVTGFKPGDRVMAFLTWGAFAEEVPVASAALAHLPDKVPFDLGASFGMTHSTSYYALKQCGRLGPGQTLLVLGASGGVGMAAVELGKLMGARVIACASTAEKLEACRKSGADELINYETENLRERLKELAGEKGVDVCYDPVGGKYAEPALRSMAWEGRYLVVGFASGEIPKIALNLALIKGCFIMGIRRGQFMLRRPKDSAENIRELLQWIAEGRLKPVISARYPLERAGDAINDLANRRIIGKAVLEI